MKTTIIILILIVIGLAARAQDFGTLAGVPTGIAGASTNSTPSDALHVGGSNVWLFVSFTSTNASTVGDLVVDLGRSLDGVCWTRQVGIARYTNSLLGASSNEAVIFNVDMRFGEFVRINQIANRSTNSDYGITGVSAVWLKKKMSTATINPDLLKDLGRIADAIRPHVAASEELTLTINQAEEKKSSLAHREAHVPPSQKPEIEKERLALHGRLVELNHRRNTAHVALELPLSGAAQLIAAIGDPALEHTVRYLETYGNSRLERARKFLAAVEPFLTQSHAPGHD